MYRLTFILKRAGLGTTVTEALGTLSRLVMVARMATMTLHFLQWGTPYGWLMGGLGLVSTGVMLGAVGSPSQLYYEEIP